MKLNVIGPNREKKGEIELPGQFSQPLRDDLIRRAVEAESSEKRQPYGASPDAGTRHSAYVSKRRRDYKTTYGIGQSRTPRKVMSRSGARMNWVGAFAPQTVGGRRSHPPKAEKIWSMKINKKEKDMAIRSAIAATINKDIVEQRGHIVPEGYPFIIDKSSESLKRTKEVIAFLESIGLGNEIERGSIKKVRPGKGKTRGRKYKRKKSTLIVTGENCPLLKASRNVPGIDALRVSDLTATVLAPGAAPGRLTLWTSSSIEKLAKEGLYK
ncbi:50S ribosomal protein L4 [Candidatus Woesearchaeota archaeon]|nr:50S ribosomal protein L4 [Candidatus Woesearchaeota archaeon]